ncbi:MAG: hypothetical protein ABSF97_12680 [Candidatus Sulfotelmatobacter sp.]|jgi:hypothetical protein
MPISAIDTVSLAVEHTKQQLFKPFRVGQWTKLAVVGLLAGELGSGNGCNFHLPVQPGGSPHGGIPGLPGVDIALLAGVISVLVVTGVLLGIILMYVGSVMRFVLFDSILAKECNISRGWNSRQGPGWRYFLWKLLYLLFTLGGMAVLLGIPAAFAFAAGWFTQPREHLLPLILGGILLFFAVMVFVILLAVIFVLTKDFVIPQMALENIGAIEGWRRLWPMISADKGGYAGYLGLKIVMAIGAGIVVGIATLILGLIIAVPTVGLSIVAVITGKTAGLTWNSYTITVAIVVGSILLSFFLYLVSLISVPVLVFFPAYSIYFFAARYPLLNAALHPATAAAQVPGAVPRYEPPPLPPSAAPIG